MIVRTPRPETGFTVLANDVIRDSRLSWRARGLLVYLLSLPDNWRTNSVHLAKAGVEGRDAVRTALDELARHGYLLRVRSQDQAGRWATTTYVFDRPQQVTPTLWESLGITGTPAPDNPAPDCQAVYEVPRTNDVDNQVSTRDPSREPTLCGNCLGMGVELYDGEYQGFWKCRACNGGGVIR